MCRRQFEHTASLTMRRLCIYQDVCHNEAYCTYILTMHMVYYTSTQVAVTGKCQYHGKSLRFLWSCCLVSAYEQECKLPAFVRPGVEAE